MFKACGNMGGTAVYSSLADFSVKDFFYEHRHGLVYSIREEREKNHERKIGKD